MSEHRVSSCPKPALSHLVGRDQFFKCPGIRKNSVVSTISKSRLAVYEHKCLADLHNRGSASAPRVHFQPTNNHCNQPTNCKCTKSPLPTNQQPLQPTNQLQVHQESTSNQPTTTT